MPARRDAAAPAQGQGRRQWSSQIHVCALGVMGRMALRRAARPLRGFFDIRSDDEVGKGALARARPCIERMDDAR